MSLFEGIDQEHEFPGEPNKRRNTGKGEKAYGKSHSKKRRAFVQAGKIFDSKVFSRSCNRADDQKTSKTHYCIANDIKKSG